MELEFGPVIQDSCQRHLQVSFEKEGNVRSRCEVVDSANPFRRTTAHDIASKCGVDVTIAKHQVTRPQQRKKLTLVTIRKVGCVNETEGRRSEQVQFFGFARCALDDGG